MDNSPGVDRASLLVRAATETDLEDISSMVQEFVVGHPAERHPRPLSKLREAYFGTNPTAHLLVAVRRGRTIGMAQWARIYDMFWAMFGGEVEWLYVRPEARGVGVPAAIIAEMCRQVRLVGGELLRGAAEEAKNAALYERVAMGWPSRVCYVSGEAFQVFADLAGRAPREIVSRRPSPDLNRIAARPR
jgi:GNAT superfamily N-acetyltransferase